MPDPSLTCFPPAPCRKVASGRLQLIQKDQGAGLYLKIKKLLIFSFDSTLVTFFEHVLTFYQRISGHIGS